MWHIWQQSRLIEDRQVEGSRKIAAANGHISFTLEQPDTEVVSGSATFALRLLALGPRLLSLLSPCSTLQLPATHSHSITGHVSLVLPPLPAGAMGKKQSKNRVKKNPKHKTLYKSIRTRRRTKDVDQIQDDIAAVAANPQLNTRSLDYDLPGMGQFYCLCCASVQSRTQLTQHRGRRLREGYVLVGS